MPFRPLLRPGAAVLRRGRGQWQLGTVVIDDRPGLRALLGLLDGVRDADRIADLARDCGLTSEVDRLLDELHRRGAVVDAGSWPGGVPRPELNHAALTGGEPTHLAARRTMQVAVDHDLASTAAARSLELLLETTGLRTGADGDVLVVISTGEPARGPFEAAVAEGITHLPVVLDETRVRLGPFVVPGRTPCLGCADAARERWDRAWRAMTLQLDQPGARPSTHAVSALDLHAAIGELAADLIAFAEGRPVRSVAARLTLGRGDMDVEPVGFSSSCHCRLW